MINMKFDVYYKDKKTGRLEIENGHVIKNESYVDDYFEYPFLNMKDDLVILSYISERAIPPDRGNLEDILRNSGYTEYNAYQIVRDMHGVVWEDFIWFKFDEDGDITWNDVRVR